MNFTNLSSYLLVFSSTLFVFDASRLDFEQVYKDCIKGLLKDIDDERRAIFMRGVWVETKNWSPVTQLMSSAYHLSLEALRKLNRNESHITEFRLLNEGLLELNKKFQKKNLSIDVIGDQLKIDFFQYELYHNNHEDLNRSEFSLSYLPIWGLLYNEHPTNQKVIRQFILACDKYNPINLMQEYSKSLSVTVGIRPSSQMLALNELLRLEKRAADDRLHFYMLAILHTECLALSQKAVLDIKDPIPLTNLYQFVVVALNILQKKYLNAARLINRHAEL